VSSIQELPDKVERALAIARRDSGFPRFAINDALDYEEYETLVREFPAALLPPEDGHHLRQFQAVKCPSAGGNYWKLFNRTNLSQIW
jgi:hypothetical protein